jgi:hypothetical protein
MRKFGEWTGAERSVCLIRSLSSVVGLERGIGMPEFDIDIITCPIDKRKLMAESLSEKE